MTQQFLKIIEGNIKNIETRMNTWFEEMYRERFKIAKTNYVIKDDKVTAFIQYYATHE